MVEENLEDNKQEGEKVNEEAVSSPDVNNEEQDRGEIQEEVRGNSSEDDSDSFSKKENSNKSSSGDSSNSNDRQFNLKNKSEKEKMQEIEKEELLEEHLKNHSIEHVIKEMQEVKSEGKGRSKEQSKENEHNEEEDDIVHKEELNHNEENSLSDIKLKIKPQDKDQEDEPKIKDNNSEDKEKKSTEEERVNIVDKEKDREREAQIRKQSQLLKKYTKYNKNNSSKSSIFRGDTLSQAHQAQQLEQDQQTAKGVTKKFTEILEEEKEDDQENEQPNKEEKKEEDNDIFNYLNAHFLSLIAGKQSLEKDIEGIKGSLSELDQEYRKLIFDKDLEYDILSDPDTKIDPSFSALETYFNLRRIEAMFDITPQKRMSYIKAIHTIVKNRGLLIKHMEIEDNLYDLFLKDKEKEEQNLKHKKSRKATKNLSHRSGRSSREMFNSATGFKFKSESYIAKNNEKSSLRVTALLNNINKEIITYNNSRNNSKELSLKTNNLAISRELEVENSASAHNNNTDKPNAFDSEKKMGIVKYTDNKCLEEGSKNELSKNPTKAIKRRSKGYLQHTKSKMENKMNDQLIQQFMTQKQTAENDTNLDKLENNQSEENIRVISNKTIPENDVIKEESEFLTERSEEKNKKDAENTTETQENKMVNDGKERLNSKKFNDYFAEDKEKSSQLIHRGVENNIQSKENHINDSQRLSKKNKSSKNMSPKSRSSNKVPNKANEGKLKYKNKKDNLDKSNSMEKSEDYSQGFWNKSSIPLGSPKDKVTLVVPEDIEQIDYYFQFFSHHKPSFLYYLGKVVYQSFKYISYDKIYFSFLELITVMFCSCTLKPLREKMLVEKEKYSKQFNLSHDNMVFCCSKKIDRFIERTYQKLLLYETSRKKIIADLDYTKIFKYQQNLAKLKFIVFDNHQRRILENLNSKEIEQGEKILSMRKENEEKKKLYYIINDLVETFAQENKEVSEETVHDLGKLMTCGTLLSDLIISHGKFTDRDVRFLKMLGSSKQTIDNLYQFVEHKGKKAGILKKKLVRKEDALENIIEEIQNYEDYIKSIHKIEEELENRELMMTTTQEQ